MTKLSPHQLLFGTKPQIHIEAAGEDRSPTATNHLINMQQAQVHASQALLKHYQVKMPKQQFEEGEKVWLDGWDLSLKTPSQKLAPKCYGPFVITKKISPVAYWINLPSHMQIHNMFHIDLLSPFVMTAQFGPSFQPPLPDLMDGHEEQEIEAILDVRRPG